MMGQEAELFATSATTSLLRREDPREPQPRRTIYFPNIGRAKESPLREALKSCQGSVWQPAGSAFPANSGFGTTALGCQVSLVKVECSSRMVRWMPGKAIKTVSVRRKETVSLISGQIATKWPLCTSGTSALLPLIS